MSFLAKKQSPAAAVVASKVDAKSAPSMPAKRLSIKETRDGEIQNVTGLWENEGKFGAFYKGTQDGITYYVDPRKDGNFNLKRQEGKGASVELLTILKKNDKGNLVGSIKDGPMFIVTDAKPRAEA